MGADMDNGSADIIAGIKELRAKVEAQLTGNDYYMIAQQLDALAASTETPNAAAKSLLNSIELRLNGADPGCGGRQWRCGNVSVCRRYA